MIGYENVLTKIDWMWWVHVMLEILIMVLWGDWGMGVTKWGRCGEGRG